MGQEVQQGEHVRYIRSEPDSAYDLMNEVKVAGIGPLTPVIDLAIVGEAPGKDEAQAREPFVGRAGRYLKGYLSEAGIGPDSVYYTNVIDRRPPNNKIDDPQALNTIKAQRQEFWNEMRWLMSKGCKTIIALGNTAKEAFGIEEPITKVRGSIYEIETVYEGVVTDPSAEPCDFVVIPTYHPSFLMRSGGRGRKSEGVSTNLTTLWVGDFKKAQDLRFNGYKRPVENFTLNPTFDEVMDFVDEVTTHATPVALDIETSGLDPQRDKVICIGLATDAETAICIPMYRTGPGVQRLTHYWPMGQQERVKQAVERVLVECPLVLQNATFDLNYLSNAGWKVADEPEHDVMLLDHAIDPEATHSLDNIVSRYGATPYWKGDFNFRKTSIWEMDSTDLQTYNCRDCIVLWQVLAPMLKALDAEGTRKAYEENIAMVPVIIMMQSTGALVSKSRLNALKRSLTESIEESKEQMNSIVSVPPSFNVDSDDDVRLLVYGYVAPKFERAKDYEKHDPKTKVYKNKKALVDTLNAVKPLWRPNQTKRTSKGVPSVSKEGLLSYRIAAQNRLEQLSKLKKPTSDHFVEKANIERILKWIEVFNDYKVYEKLYSSYTSYPIRSDGRVHPSYLIHGTATSRLSSNKPSLQVQPKKNKEVRKIFVAASGYTIVSADYSNLEFRCMAYETTEPSMIQVVEEGLNYHDMNTKLLFGIDENDPSWDVSRRAAKIFAFAGQYGAGPRTMYEKILNEVPDFRMTYGQFNQAVANWYAEKPVYSKWAEDIKRQARENRMVWNSFGRNRTLYGREHEIEKQALNFPCQSAAAHIINQASIRVYHRIVEEGWDAAIQAQIHDQLVFEVRSDVVRPFIERVVRPEMETVVDWHDNRAEFPVDIEVGPSWGELEPWQ